MGKKVIFVLGDSFAAGYGIEDVQDRFSDVLQEKLGEGWRIINISQPRWNTDAEYQALVSYPHSPHIVVLSYLINDIDDACVWEGLRFDFPSRISNRMVRVLVNRSYVLNFAYWSLLLYSNRDIGTKYVQYLRTCFANERVWQSHQQQLQKIVDYTKQRGADFIAVIFPELRNIEGTRAFTTQVANWLLRKNVHVIDLATRLEGRNPRELIVHEGDGHPSVSLHQEVAELLFQTIRKIEARGTKPVGECASMPRAPRTRAPLER